MALGRITRQGLAALALAALMCAPALAASGKRLDKSGDAGFPGVFVTGGAQTPKKFTIRVKAHPNLPVEVRWDISCARNGKGRFRLGETTIGGRKGIRIKPTFKRGTDECIVNALVAFDDSGTVGKIRADLFVK